MLRNSNKSVISVIFSLCFVITLSLFSSGCVEPTSSPAKPAKQNATQKPANNQNAAKKPANTAAANKNKDFTNKNLAKWKFAKFTMVGSESMAKVKQPVAVGRAGLRVSGWALDRNLDGAAKKVQVRVGSKVFDAKNKRPTPYLGKSMNKPAYNNAGFVVKIPWAELPRGMQQVEIIVHNAAGTKSVSEQKIKVNIAN